MTPNGEAYKLVCERLGQVRTPDAPTWKEVWDAVRGELGEFERCSFSLASDLLGLLDQKTICRFHTYQVFNHLCQDEYMYLFRAVLARGNLPSTHLANALDCAVMSGDLDMTRLALDHGAPVDGSDDRRPPLEPAIVYSNVNMVQLLLERGADRSRTSHGFTMGQVAAKLSDDHAHERHAILELLRGEP